MCESNVKCRAGEGGREGRLRSCIGTQGPWRSVAQWWAPPASSSPVDGALWPSSWLLCSSQVQPVAPQPSPTQPARTATQPLSCCEDKKNLTKFSKDPSSLTWASGRHLRPLQKHPCPLSSCFEAKKNLPKFSHMSMRLAAEATKFSSYGYSTD